ncbi:MAG TPA: hypothetical protein VEZ90_00965, partial [Blastocatellia bacterium]|nr:hypothetical protein [Blastocatellia bacterium]
PFNIVTRRDTNGDTLFTARPAFATDLNRPSVVETPLGNFDLNPLPGEQIVPRDFGRGPSFFSMNLGVTKSLAFDGLFGHSRRTQDADSQNNGPSILIPKSKKASSNEKRYRFVVAVNCDNLFNHANGAVPIGNLSSPEFGQSISSAGPFGGGVLQSSNRRLRFQLRFEF